MPDFYSWKRPLAMAALTALICTAPAPRLGAEQAAPTPDFSSNDVGWVFGAGDYIPIPGEPSPTRNDPAYPYVSNADSRARGVQPTYRVADLSNPNIKPWAKEVMKRENDKVLAGGMGFSWRAACLPSGVPAFLQAVVEPIQFMQTPKQVTMVFSGDAQVRRIYLDVPHSENPKPSWNGESVGHYEGDTLVVDTIGLHDKSFIDSFRTPHTGKLHVVERYRLVDDGKTLEVTFRIDDPDTFYQPWTAMARLRRVPAQWREEACAENNEHLFDYGMPVADKPDF
jgi:hypothetical protein